MYFSQDGSSSSVTVLKCWNTNKPKSLNFVGFHAVVIKVSYITKQMYNSPVLFGISVATLWWNTSAAQYQKTNWTLVLSATTNTH